MQMNPAVPSQPHDNRLLAALRSATDRINALEEVRREPIAVVGLACRLPGGVHDEESYWHLLRSGLDAVDDVPGDRWSTDSYHGDPGAAGKIASRRGGFLDEVDLFDPRVFGISPREALDMDPQQRIALETAWWALENAAADWTALKGSKAGVFMGATTNDYSRLCLSGRTAAQIEPHFATGNALNSIAGRISYTFGLQGPCMTIDTACSSSLVAVHLACQSLRNEECDTALAGGVNLMLLPEASIAASRARMLAPDGRCKTFDAAADGYVRSEGCGLVVLRRLSDAVRERCRILAVVRGSAVNQNGEGSGLTVPSRSAQESLIRNALRTAGLSASDIGYVEAHGTGTSLGDPIELNALSAVYGKAPRAHPLLVGSVKTNIGHAESAAGVAGLIKAILAVGKGKLPPSLHLREPTPHFPWKDGGIEVCTELRDWPAGVPRRAGVSSFGASGSNAHLVLEARASPDPSPPTEPSEALLALSARSASALRLTAQQAADWFDRSDADFSDVCRTVNLRRQWPHRLIVRAATCAEAAAALRDFVAGKSHPRLSASEDVAADRPLRVRLLLGVTDPALPQTVAALFAAAPLFRAALERIIDDLAIASSSSWLAALRAGDADDMPIDDAVAFGIVVAQVRSWESCGIVAESIAASGGGLRAAAYLAGAADLAWVRATLGGDWPALAFRPHLPIHAATSGEELTDRLRDAVVVARIAGETASPISPEPGTITLAAGSDAHADGVRRAYLAGVDIDWNNASADYRSGPVAFPPSIFERQRYWPEPAAQEDDAPGNAAALVDRHVHVVRQSMTVVESDTGPRGRDVYRDHLVFDRIVVAGACHVSLMIEACARHWPRSPVSIANLGFERALALGDDSAKTIQVVLDASTPDATLVASSFDTVDPGAQDVTHARAQVRLRTIAPLPSGARPIEEARARCAHAIDGAAFYRDLQRGTRIEHRAAFRWVEAISHGTGVAIGRLRAPEQAETFAGLHPGLLDSCFQLIAAAFGTGEAGTFVPYRIGAIDVMRAGASGPLTAIAEIASADPQGDMVTGHVQLYDEALEPVISIENLQFRRAAMQVLIRDEPQDGPGLYGLSWETAPARGEPTTACLDTAIIAHDADFAATLAAALAPDFAASRQVLTLERDAGDDRVRLRPEDAARLDQRIATATDARSKLRIIYLAMEQGGSDGLLNSEAGVLDISRALDASYGVAELFIVTRAAIDSSGCAGERVDPAQSGIWAFAGVLANERPELAVRVVDIGADQSARDLADGLGALAPGDRFALRQRSLRQARLTRVATDAAALSLRPDASYLITGAFGGIGHLVARDFAARGARRLVLIGRHTRSAAALALIRELEALDVTVFARAVDVADAGALQQALDELAAVAPPIAGVVHCAAVLDDAAIRATRWEQIKAVIAPKATGAWNLHHAFRDHPLDHFILFSSAAALFGTPGQAAYAAANGTLDGIAALRRHAGQPALSIAWGPWDGIGMTAAMSAAQTRALERSGLGVIGAAEGMDMFGRVAVMAVPQAVVMALDAAKADADGGHLTRSGLLRDLAGFGHASRTGPKPDAAFADASLTVEQKLAIVLDFCRGVIAETLRSGADDIPADAPLASLGVDSLMALELSARINAAFGVELPLERFMEQATLADLAGQIAQTQPQATAPREARDYLADSVGVGELIGQIDAMSEEEMAALLAELKGDTDMSPAQG